MVELSWVDSTIDNYTCMYMYDIQLFSFRLKQPYNLSEILLDRLAIYNCKHKMEKMQINFKIELLKMYKFLIFLFVPMFLN